MAIDVVVDDVPLLGVSASDRTTITATASTGDPDVLLVGDCISSLLHVLRSVE